MGSTFSNLQIRKRTGLSLDDFERIVSDALCEKGYSPSENKEDADVSCALFEGEAWFGLYTNDFDYAEPTELAQFAKYYSLRTDCCVLCISCFDSDVLLLHAIKPSERINARASTGLTGLLRIRKKTNAFSWRKVTSESKKLKEIMDKEYDFAEDALEPIGEILNLPVEQSNCSYVQLYDMGLADRCRYIYFSKPRLKTDIPVKLECILSNLMHCRPDMVTAFSCINKGGASKGIDIYFSGECLQDNSNTISDVQIMHPSGGRLIEFEDTPISFEQITLPDGTLGFHCSIPDLPLPEINDQGISELKRFVLYESRSFVFRFIPHGDEIKLLSLTVTILARETKTGFSWNVFNRYGGSKEAYVKEYNDHWSKLIPADRFVPLKLENINEDKS